LPTKGFHLNGGGKTANAAEIALCIRLTARGYAVHKRGWPDLFAVRTLDDGEVEICLIEVKPHAGLGLAPAQRQIAELLALKGIRVQLWSPDRPDEFRDALEQKDYTRPDRARGRWQNRQHPWRRETQR